MCANVVKEEHRDTPVSIIRVKQVQALLGISRTTIWRNTHDPDGSFPIPVRLSHKSIGFYAHEIEAYLLSLPRVITTNKLGVNHEEN
jgi:predicted DNA-binding transcriptional regulator AlpA